MEEDKGGMIDLGVSVEESNCLGDFLWRIRWSSLHDVFRRSEKAREGSSQKKPKVPVRKPKKLASHPTIRDCL